MRYKTFKDNTWIITTKNGRQIASGGFNPKTHKAYLYIDSLNGVWDETKILTVEQMNEIAKIMKKIEKELK